MVIRQIRFGAHDGPICPACKRQMIVNRRTPHPRYGTLTSYKLSSAGPARMKSSEVPTGLVSLMSAMRCLALTFRSDDPAVFDTGNRHNDMQQRWQHGRMYTARRIGIGLGAIPA
jgi:hypothetical protein